MILVDEIQGTEGWHKVRLENFTASEAPAMMGKGKYQSRDDLLRLKKTGIAPEVDAATQRLFDKGHAAEASIRPHIEKILEEELYPVVGILEGTKLLASFDGLTLMEDVVFEHKLWNEKLAKTVQAKHDGEPVELEEHYTIQLDQQLLVSGADKAIFVVSDGTPEKMVWCWYETSKEKTQALVDGWAQFEKDLKNYEVKTKPEAIEAQTQPALPALQISVTGMVNSSNLSAYKASAFQIIESINTSLASDQDFADAEEAIKFLKKGESELEVGKKAILNQTASIDEVFKTIDEISETMRQKRLYLNKLVKQQKEAIKQGIVSSTVEAMQKFWDREAEDCPLAGLCPIHVDVAGAIKGLRTINSIENAANTALANAKIEANKILARIKTNSELFNKEAANFKFLFNDVRALINKDPGDFKSIVLMRIAEHEALIQQREEAERDRIAAQERAKIQRELEAQERAKAEEEMDAPVSHELTTAREFAKPEPIQVKATLPPGLLSDLEEWARGARVSNKKFNELKDILLAHQQHKAA